MGYGQYRDSARHADTARALRRFRARIAHGAKDIVGWVELGENLRSAGRYQEACGCLERAVAAQPNRLDSLFELARVYGEGLGRRKEERELLLRVILDEGGGAAGSSNGLSAQAWSMLVDSLVSEPCIDRTFVALRRLEPRLPEVLPLYLSIAERLADNGRYFDAIACNEAILRQHPGFGAAFINLGKIAVSLGEIERGIEHFQSAMRADPNNILASVWYSQTLLMKGDWNGAQRECSRVQDWAEFANPAGTCPNWRGEPLSGKAIVFEPGPNACIGDQILCARFAWTAKQEAARVVMKCHPDLVELFRRVKGIDEVVRADRESPPADYQSIIAMVQAYRPATPESLGANVPYIICSREDRDHWEQIISGYLRPGDLKIGICWRGSTLHLRDFYRCRSIPLADFRPLFGIEGTTLFSLQRGTGSEELVSGHGGVPVVALADSCRNLSDLAAAVSEMDLVITIDTSIAHLSGAIGRPTRILLPFSAEWRWLRDRADTPWYPTARLFRQPEPGDWGAVLRNVSHELRSAVASRVVAPACGASMPDFRPDAKLSD